MAVHPPTLRELRRIADAYGFELSDEQLAEFAASIGPALASYRRIDELADTFLPVKYPRAELGYRPLTDDNPSHGWIWKCSIPGAADGPLAGRRIGVKDNVSVAGVPMLNGTQIMEGFVPREDATVVTRLLDAGAEIIGKTAVPAFCFDGGGFTGYPDPQPVNPNNPEYLAGSSSNGSAVVVMTGQADVALGGDQGGSIRMPASWSGCVGLKPTHGLVPYTGIFPIELTLDHCGPMARTVADCALTLAAIAGSDGLDPRQYAPDVGDYVAALEEGVSGLRVGVLEEGFGISGASEDDVDETVTEAARSLEQLGAKVTSVSVPLHADGLAIWSAIANEGATYQMVAGDAFGTNWKGHYSTDIVDFYGRGRRARGHDFPDTVKLTVLVGQYMSERYNHHYYAKARNIGRRLAAEYASAFDEVDVLALPTTAMKARKVPVDPNLSDYLLSALGNLHNTAPFDVTGNPALSVPCHTGGGLPIGLQLVGRPFDEVSIIRAGQAFERSRS